MSLGGIVLSLATLVYGVAGVIYLIQGDFKMLIVMAGYSVANVGLILK